MLAVERPHRRLLSDSPRLDRTPARLQAADRHAMRLGVLGHVECRQSGLVLPTNEMPGADCDNLHCGELVALPLTEPAWRKPLATASVLPFPMIAA